LKNPILLKKGGRSEEGGVCTDSQWGYSSKNEKEGGRRPGKKGKLEGTSPFRGEGFHSGRGRKMVSSEGEKKKGTYWGVSWVIPPKRDPVQGGEMGEFPISKKKAPEGRKEKSVLVGEQKYGGKKTVSPFRKRGFHQKRGGKFAGTIDH